MAGRKIRDAAEARASLDAAARDGLAPVDWARRHGVDGRSLNAWRMNLARASRAKRAPGPVRLVELVVAEPAPAKAPTRRASQYVVRCGAFEVGVDDGFDDEGLLRLLRVVAAC